METKRVITHSRDPIPLPKQPDDAGHKSEPTEDNPSIPEAANQLGIDAFCLYGLIQRGAVRPERASNGRFYLPPTQIESILQGLPEDF